MNIIDDIIAQVAASNMPQADGILIHPKTYYRLTQMDRGRKMIMRLKGYKRKYRWRP